MVALADAFARAGHDVFLVLLCRGGVRVPWPVESRVRVVEIGASAVQRSTHDGHRAPV